MPRALRSQPAGTPAAEPEPFLHKLLLVGESNTGKTSLALRWVHNVFRPQTKATIGVDFHLKTVPINDNTNVIVQLWDVSGQERFSQMTRVFYGGAVGAVVTFDVTQNDTFEAVAAWKDDIDKKCFLSDGRNIPVMLMGTKSDLAANPVRSDEEMNDFCVKHGFVGWHTTSSKTGANVNDAFVELIRVTAKNDADIQTAEAAAVIAANPEPVRRAPTRRQMLIQTVPPAAGSRPNNANPRSPSPPADFNFVLASPAPTGAAVHHHPPAVAGHSGATTVHLHHQPTETKKKNRKCFGIF